MNRFAALRSTVDRFLVDSCVIRENVPAPVFDDDSGTYSDTTGDVVYSGRCWIRASMFQRDAEAGESLVSTRMYDVTLPWDTVGVNRDHLLTVTESDDPHLVGRVLRVSDLKGGSNNPHRRLVCEDTLTVTVEEEEVGS